MMKNTALIVGIVVVVVLLAGAAFFGAQMLSGPEAADGADSGRRVMEIISDNGSGPVSVRLTFAPAPELPDRPAETSGVFIRREDNSIFVGTGNIELDVEVDGATGEKIVSLNHSGPEVEVVVGHDTVVYHDVTKIDIENKSSGQPIQQVVEPAASVDDVLDASRTELQVWGEQRGDRVIAAVLVYRETQ